MTNKQKRNLLITLSLILLLIATLTAYWVIIKFNPFIWIANHANYFILMCTLGLAGGLMLLGFYLTHKHRL